MHHTKGTSPYASRVSIKTVATLILVVLCLAFCIVATWTYTNRLSPAQQAASEREQLSRIHLPNLRHPNRARGNLLSSVSFFMSASLRF